MNLTFIVTTYKVWKLKLQNPLTKKRSSALRNTYLWEWDTGAYRSHCWLRARSTNLNRSSIHTDTHNTHTKKHRHQTTLSHVTNLQLPIRTHVHIWAVPQSMYLPSSSSIGCVGNVKDKLKWVCLPPCPPSPLCQAPFPNLAIRRDAPRPPTPTKLWSDGWPVEAASGLAAPSSHPHSLSVPWKSIYEFKENTFLKKS